MLMEVVNGPNDAGKSGGVEELLAKADAYRLEGRYEEAVPKYKEVLQIDADNIQAHIGVGLIYSFGYEGLFEEAIHEFQRVIELAPDRTDVRIYLAKAYQQIGMYQESKEEFLRVLELDPGNAEAEKQVKFLEEWGF